MNPIFGITILSAFVYWCFIDAAFLKIYLILIICYTILTQFSGFSRFNDLRRKIFAADWDGLNDPQILVTFQWNMHKAEAFF